MRFRVKPNINYWNIIKDDIKVKYKNKKSSKISKKIKNILNNRNFRNNQNYVLSKQIVDNNFIFLKEIISKIIFIISIFLSLILISINTYLWFFSFLVVIVIYTIYNIKNDIDNDNSKYYFTIKESYYKRHFIVTADKKISKN